METLSSSHESVSWKFFRCDCMCVRTSLLSTISLLISDKSSSMRLTSSGAEAVFLDHLVPEGASGPQIFRDVALGVQQIHCERFDLLGGNSSHFFNRL